MFQDEAIDLSEAKSFFDIETKRVVGVGDAVKRNRRSGRRDQVCSI
jgi:hypothetical protein